MKLKIFLFALLLVFVFGVAGNVFAMTEQERQALIAQITAQLAELKAQVAQKLQEEGEGADTSSTPSTTATQSTAWCYTFNTNLGFANSGSSEVAQLHTALQKEGISYGADDANAYTQDTADAVAQFQTKYGISPASGYVAAKTRAKLNALYGCSSSSGKTASPVASRSNPNCIPNWVCDSWSACKGIPSSRTRTCTDSNNCGVTTGKPSEKESNCQCVPDFQCTKWGECKTDYNAVTGKKIKDYRERTCTDLNGCAVGSQYPKQIEDCSYSCAPSWTCGDWSICSNGQQTRACTDKYKCGDNTGKPETTQSCAEHTSCVNKKCTIVKGSGDNMCKEDNDCDDDGLRVLACVNNKCMASAGNYYSSTTCSNKSEGAYCGTGESHTECTNVQKDRYGFRSGTCTTVEGPGDNICGSDRDCTGTVLSCVNRKCAVTAGSSHYGSVVTSCSEKREGDYCGTGSCTPKWTCSNWSGCSNNQQTRTCTDANTCDTDEGKPETSQSCSSSGGGGSGGGGDGGGGGGTTCPSGSEGWSCGTWSTCYGSYQTRNCEYTGPVMCSRSQMPATTQSCTITPLTCTPNLVCGSWGACTNGYKNRTCTDSNNCGPGTTVEQQSCVAACTPNWTCGSWTACSNSQQSRTCTDSNNCGTTTGKPSTTQSCCTPSWTCGSWSTCSSWQIQTRTCTDSSRCGTTTGQPATTQSCTVTPCVSNWVCGPWSTCAYAGNSYQTQTRTCTDYNYCPVATNWPAISQMCSTTATCTPNWTCGAWGTCSNGQQTRSCTDTYYCGAAIDAANPAVTTQSCCSPTWVCGDWGECISGWQTKTCTDSNNCGTYVGNPSEGRNCTTIGASITFTSPVGGEIWTQGKDYTISWNAVGVSDIRVFLVCPGSSGVQIGGSNQSGPGSNIWTVSNYPVFANQRCRLSASGYGRGGTKDRYGEYPYLLLTGASSGYFTIVPPTTSFVDSSSQTASMLSSIAEKIAGLLQQILQLEK